jgi:hypothetical protein
MPQVEALIKDVAAALPPPTLRAPAPASASHSGKSIKWNAPIVGQAKV